MKTTYKLPDEIISVLSENDWNIISDVKYQNGSCYVEIENYSPAGEDLVETIWFDGTDTGFINGVRTLADNFDPEEHVELLIDSRGKNGVPESIRDLLTDADAIATMYNDLAEALEQLIIK